MISSCLVHCPTHPEANALSSTRAWRRAGRCCSPSTSVSGSFADSLVAKGFIVYLMDIRGWRESTAPLYNKNDTSLTAGSCVEAAEDIDAVVDHIRQREHLPRVSLFGWAAGGHWVAYYTTHHNDKVDHLIVLNTLYGINAPWSYNSAFANPSDSNHYDTHIPIYRISDTKSTIAYPKPHKPHAIQELTFSIGGGLTTDLGYTIKIHGDSVLLFQEKFIDSATNIIRYEFVALLDTGAHIHHLNRRISA